MKGLLAIGVLLLAIGIGVLAWPVISYTERDKAIDLGPVEVFTQEEEHVRLPRILGFAGIAAGAALIVLGSRTRTV